LKFPPENSFPSILNSAFCTRTTRACTGVKKCQFIASELMYSHTSIEDIDWLQIENARRSHDKPSLERETNAFVILSITNLFTDMLLDFTAQCF
jgi:hypothetical protein